MHLCFFQFAPFVLNMPSPSRSFINLLSTFPTLSSDVMIGDQMLVVVVIMMILIVVVAMIITWCGYPLGSEVCFEDVICHVSISCDHQSSVVEPKCVPSFSKLYFPDEGVTFTNQSPMIILFSFCPKKRYIHRSQTTCSGWHSSTAPKKAPT